MGQSMLLVNQQRPPNGTAPGMSVVPNAGKAGVQWFNFQRSGFTASGNVNVCYAPPGGNYTCILRTADNYGVAGLALQIHSVVTGTWSVYMCNGGGTCTPTRTFNVLP
jgi:hypothetical protein